VTEKGFGRYRDLAPRGAASGASSEGRVARLEAREEDSAVAAYTPDEGLDFWTRTLRARCFDALDAVVVIDGERGFGKSTLALRMARRIAPRWGIGSLCYTPLALVRAYRTHARGDVILFDEGVRGFLSTDTFDPDQKALIRTLTLVREKGIVLIICAPSIWQIAKQVRSNLAWLWVHVQRRGLALAHVRDGRLRYTPDTTLGLFRSVECPWLEWAKFRDTDPLLRSYSTEKARQMAAFLEETEDTMRGGKKGVPLSGAERLARWRAAHPDRYRAQEARRRAKAGNAAVNAPTPTVVAEMRS
jgi:hypothetical protein